MTIEIDRAGGVATFRGEGWKRSIPIVVAGRIPGSAHDCQFWCRWCDEFHGHGLGDGPRAPHCSTADSPYRLGGNEYYLIVTEERAARPPLRERRKPIRDPYGRLYHGWKTPEERTRIRDGS